MKNCDLQDKESQRPKPVQSVSHASIKTYSAGTHRVIAPEQTRARLQPLLPHMGVTRVAQVTQLDRIGIPVFSSVRPNSQSLSLQQGKGLSEDAAWVSAVMESYEAHCGERTRAGDVLASRSSLGQPAIVPEAYLRKPFDDHAAIAWSSARDIVSGASTYVPADLVTMDFRWPSAPGFGRFLINTGGIAAGNVWEEAVLHGLCELIEHDAFSLWRQAPPSHRHATRVDPRELSDPCVQELVAQFERARIAVDFWETTTDTDVPSFFCLIDDRAAAPPFLGRFGGNGTHPSVAVAACRALTEAAQSRLTFIAGARDDLAPETYANVNYMRNLASLVARTVEGTAEMPRSIRASSYDSDSVAQDLARTLSRLRQAGIDEIYVCDLSDPEIGLSCVRVLAPQLEGMHHKPGYRQGERSRHWLERHAPRVSLRTSL